MTFEKTVRDRTNGMGAEAEAELLFYHTYIDHYRIAEQYVDGNIASDDLQEFAGHLAGCQECADRVLLAEMFRAQSPKRRGTLAETISETVRKIVEQAHAPSATETVLPEAENPTRATRTPVLGAMAHSKKLGIAPPPLPVQIRQDLKEPLVTVESLIPVEPRVTAESPVTVEPPITVEPQQWTHDDESPVAPEPKNTFLCTTYLCTYEADRRGCRTPTRAGGAARCPLPQRARVIAKFSPLQLMLLGGAAALVLMAIPCGLFMLELARIARN